MRGGVSKLVDLGSVREQLRVMQAEGRHDELLDIVLAMLETMQRKNSELELERLRLLRKHLGKTSEKTPSEQQWLLHWSLATHRDRVDLATHPIRPVIACRSLSAIDQRAAIRDPRRARCTTHARRFARA